jgi:hypothetical protein
MSGFSFDPRGAAEGDAAVGVGEASGVAVCVAAGAFSRCSGKVQAVTKSKKTDKNRFNMAVFVEVIAIIVQSKGKS